MSWTYTSNPAGEPIDLVRFLCGDVEEEIGLISDEEILYLLTTSGSPKTAAEDACEFILTKLAKEVDYTIGPESVKASQRFEQYEKILANLRKKNGRYHNVPLMYNPSDNSRDAIFDIGMHDVRGITYGPSDTEE